jgi:Domain of unknown function (DUF4912)
VPFFFDLSSLVPTVERNPFEPVVVHDEVPADVLEAKEEIPAEPIVDTGLPIPSHYDFDMMRALVQDPFRIFVYWQLKDNPFERLDKIFPASEISSFYTVLKLIDETNNIAVFFDAAFAREYWFNIFPDRRYRVELGLRSHIFGYIKLLSSQTVITPRGAPSDQMAEEPEYSITTDDYLRVLRESHIVPERAFTVDGLLPGADGRSAEAIKAFWESLPLSFRQLMKAIADIQAGRAYDSWWERLNQEELTHLVREFLATINQMGHGEHGYMLLLRYLPEVMRRSVQAETADTGQVELQIDKPISLYFAEKLGQAASEFNFYPTNPEISESLPGSLDNAQWLPGFKL